MEPKNATLSEKVIANTKKRQLRSKGANNAVTNEKIRPAMKKEKRTQKNIINRHRIEGRKEERIKVKR